MEYTVICCKKVEFELGYGANIKILELPSSFEILKRGIREFDPDFDFEKKMPEKDDPKCYMINECHVCNDIWNMTEIKFCPFCGKKIEIIANGK